MVKLMRMDYYQINFLRKYQSFYQFFLPEVQKTFMLSTCHPSGEHENSSPFERHENFVQIELVLHFNMVHYHG